MARSLATAQFYSHLDGKRIADGVTEIVAMDFGKHCTFLKLLYLQYIFMARANRMNQYLTKGTLDFWQIKVPKLSLYAELN